MAKGGEVFLLDMGDPVLIKELATKMINLSGLKVKDLLIQREILKLRKLDLNKAKNFMKRF